MFKSERREAKRRNSRKMRVDGRNINVLIRAQEKRDQKRFDQMRKAKQISPLSV